MMTATTLAAWVALELTTPAPPDDFADQLDHVEASGDSREFQIVGFNAAGEPIGTVALWTDESMRVHIASDYGDGYEDVVVVGEQLLRNSSLVEGAAAERANLMADLILEANWVGCAVRVAAAVTLCSPPLGATAIITCPGSAYLAICECGQAGGLTPNPGMCP